MRGSRMFCQRGSNSDFLSTKTSAHQRQIALKAGHHRPTSETPFLLWAYDGPKLNAGLVAL